MHNVKGTEITTPINIRQILKILVLHSFLKKTVQKSDTTNHLTGRDKTVFWTYTNSVSEEHVASVFRDEVK